MVIQLRGAVAFAPSYRSTITIVVLLLACAGCKSVPKELAKDDAAEATATADSKPPAPPQTPAVTLTADSPEWAALQNQNWFEQVQLGAVKRPDSFMRWRNQSLERLLHLPDTGRPDLSAALASSEQVVAANAAIVLARWGSGQPTEQLVEAIGAGDLAGNLRCAAAESLGLVQKPSPAAHLRELLEDVESQVSRHDDGEEADHELTDLHADLVRALARHAEPGDEKFFTAALGSPTWNVRLEGILAWIPLIDYPLPETAVELRNDPDPRVRAAALRAIAAHREPRAMEYLQQALSDRATDVHTTAIAAMGELGSQEAHSLLGQLKSSGSEVSRAASAAALAAAGLRSEIESAAKDTSSQVRLAVAQTKQQGHEIAEQTVNEAKDAAADVQQQAVELTAERVEQLNTLVNTLKEADLPEAARQKTIASLKQLAADQDRQMRLRAAQAMGEVADASFIPELVALLSDGIEIQRAAMTSLTLLAGTDVAAAENGQTLSDEERVMRWQRWYRDRPNQVSSTPAATRR